MEIMLERTGNVFSLMIHSQLNSITYHGKLVHGVSSSAPGYSLGFGGCLIMSAIKCAKQLV